MSSSDDSDDEVITNSKGKANARGKKRERLHSDSSDQASEVEAQESSKSDKDSSSDSEDDPEESTTSKKQPILEDDSDDSDDSDEVEPVAVAKDGGQDKAVSSDEDQAGDKSKKVADKDDDEDSSDDDNEEDAKAGAEKTKAKNKDTDSDESSSDDSDEENEGGGDPKDKADDGDDEDDDDVIPDDDDDGQEVSPTKPGTVYDFDIMMAKKKEENSRRRRRRGYDIINDNDDIIADIITQMREAVEADTEANKNKQVATNKLKLLPFLINQLRKVDLRDAFLDSDVLSVITEWLAPLPDRSLPHLNIRENLLKILIDFNLYDVDRIKGSGIGKAVMYLYKHPKETKENKQRAKQLISAWSRPIFNLDSSFSAISREEREERDKELQRRASKSMAQPDSSDGEEGSGPAPKRSKEDTTLPVAKNPGEQGWIPRARVPAPSMRDYVIRPRSKIDGDIGKGSKRPANMLEKLMKTHQERRRANKQQRAVNMKIDKC